MERKTTHALKGKVAVITGASRGIGLAIAQALAARGCHLAITSRGKGSLQAAARALEVAAGTKLLVLAADVSNQRAVLRFFAAVQRHFARVDILINNAGTAHALRHIEELPLEIWREVLDTNLTGAFLCTRAALPLMGQGGVIVNNVSVAARGVFAGESAYCASKHGLLGFTDTLREEVRERGIRVLALLPGPTATDIWNQFMPEAPRTKMMLPETVAQALVDALSLPANSAVEEILLRPVSGVI